MIAKCFLAVFRRPDVQLLNKSWYFSVLFSALFVSSMRSRKNCVICSLLRCTGYLITFSCLNILRFIISFSVPRIYLMRYPGKNPFKRLYSSFSSSSASTDRQSLLPSENPNVTAVCPIKSCNINGEIYISRLTIFFNWTISSLQFCFCLLSSRVREKSLKLWNVYSSPLCEIWQCWVNPGFNIDKWGEINLVFL